MPSTLKIGVNTTFNEAIKAAKSRGIVLPSEYYGKLQGRARSLAFSVAGITSHDKLTAIRDSLAVAISEGQSFEVWQKAIILNLPKYRKETIFRTNVQNSYNAGRWEKMQRVKSVRPYLLYDAINDSRTRPAHKKLDGVIKPQDDSFWDTHAASNGFNCRCRLISLSEAQMKARGGVTRGTPSNTKPDKGWDYNPSKNPSESIKRAVDDKPDGVFKNKLKVLLK